MTKEEFQIRYIKLAHAIQTGVKIDQELGSDCGTSKHLRVGINIALCDIGSVAGLLISKGVITQTEYFEALLLNLEKEVDKYETNLTEIYGKEVKLI